MRSSSNWDNIYAFRNSFTVSGISIEYSFNNSMIWSIPQGRLTENHRHISTSSTHSSHGCFHSLLLCCRASWVRLCANIFTIGAIWDSTMIFLYPVSHCSNRFGLSQSMNCWYAIESDRLIASISGGVFVGDDIVFFIFLNFNETNLPVTRYHWFVLYRVCIVVVIYYNQSLYLVK